MDLEEAHYIASGYPPGQDCGCRTRSAEHQFITGQGGIIYCPTHKAAFTMLELLEQLFVPDWAIFTGQRDEATLHRKVAKVLEDTGRRAG